MIASVDHNNTEVLHMKLTDELQKKIEEASGDETMTILNETKKKAKEAGILLDEEELAQVAGGRSPIRISS